ncbi:MAG: AraC family transcriptional regulator [Spirochaetes bacterium]|nr:AraC family transcriptional regulator [Spirochaetota bacterium]
MYNEIYSIFDLFIFCGSFLAFILAILVLFTIKQKRENFYLFFVFTVVFTLLFLDFILKSVNIDAGESEKNRYIYVIYSVEYLKYTLGPLCYLYFQGILKNETLFSKAELLHFIPFCSALVTLLISSLTLSANNQFLILEIIHALSIIHFFSYLVVMVNRLNLHRISFKEERNLFIYVYTILGLIFIIILVFITHFVSGIEIFHDAGLLVVCLINAVWMILIFLNPELARRFSKIVRKNSYERSLINGLNTVSLQSRLHDLMQEEKLFCDEDLTLKKTAMLLDISSHQLSELLNNVMNSNFRSFLNTYRINEAKLLLKNEPNRSITSIAYSTGFNSLSVFYHVFSKATGTTPKSYRLKTNP